MGESDISEEEQAAPSTMQARRPLPKRCSMAVIKLWQQGVPAANIPTQTHLCWEVETEAIKKFLLLSLDFSLMTICFFYKRRKLKNKATWASILKGVFPNSERTLHFL